MMLSLCFQLKLKAKIIIFSPGRNKQGQEEEVGSRHSSQGTPTPGRQRQDLHHQKIV